MNQHLAPQTSKILRTVPGRLLYVEADDGQVICVKLDTLRIKQRTGTLQNYRGESFRELGLVPGKQITVKSMDDFVFDPAQKLPMRQFIRQLILG